MGLKRLTARVEITYPADDPRTLDELRSVTPEILRGRLTDPLGPTLAWYTPLGASVDPDPEPTLPDPEPDPRDQVGRIAP